MDGWDDWNDLDDWDNPDPWHTLGGNAALGVTQGSSSGSHEVNPDNNWEYHPSFPSPIRRRHASAARRISNSAKAKASSSGSSNYRGTSSSNTRSSRNTQADPFQKAKFGILHIFPRTALGQEPNPKWEADIEYDKEKHKIDHNTDGPDNLPHLLKRLNHRRARYLPETYAEKEYQRVKNAKALGFMAHGEGLERWFKYQDKDDPPIPAVHFVDADEVHADTILYSTFDEEVNDDSLRSRQAQRYKSRRVSPSKAHTSYHMHPRNSDSDSDDDYDEEEQQQLQLLLLQQQQQQRQRQQQQQQRQQQPAGQAAGMPANYDLPPPTTEHRAQRRKLLESLDDDLRHEMLLNDFKRFQRIHKDHRNQMLPRLHYYDGHRFRLTKSKRYQRRTRLFTQEEINVGTFTGRHFDMQNHNEDISQYGRRRPHDTYAHSSSDNEFQRRIRLPPHARNNISHTYNPEYPGSSCNH